MGQAGHLCLTIFVVCIAAQLVKATINIPPVDTVLKAGEAEGTQILQCTVAAAFTNFEWKKGTDTICTVASDSSGSCVPDPTNTYRIDDSSYFDLQADKVIDYSYAGEYTCKTTESTPDPKQVTVVEPVTCTETYEIAKGTPLAISCKIKYQGKLQLNLTVTNDGDTIGSKQGPVKDVADYFEFVTEKQAFETAGDRTYKCAATFEDGILVPVDIPECNVIVTVSDRQITSPESDTVFAKEGDNSTLTCKVDTDITWTKDDEEICDTANPKCANENHVIDKPNPHDLTVVKVTDTSAGKYTCAIDSPTEFVERELVIVKDPSCKETADGKGFQCTVLYKGNVAPTLSWFKEGTKVDKLTPTAGDDDDDGWKSTMLDVTDVDVGKTYSCNVTDIKISCESLKNSAAGLEAGFYKSLLLSLAFMCLWCKFY